MIDHPQRMRVLLKMMLANSRYKTKARFKAGLLELATSASVALRRRGCRLVARCATADAGTADCSTTGPRRQAWCRDGYAGSAEGNARSVFSCNAAKRH